MSCHVSPWFIWVVRRIDTASKYITSMLTTMRFYFNKVDAIVEQHQLPSSDEDMMKKIMIPIEYLKIAAGKEQIAKDRHSIIRVADQLQKQLSQTRCWFTKMQQTKQS